MYLIKYGFEIDRSWTIFMPSGCSLLNEPSTSTIPAHRQRVGVHPQETSRLINATFGEEAPKRVFLTVRPVGGDAKL